MEIESDADRQWSGSNALHLHLCDPPIALYIAQRISCFIAKNWKNFYVFLELLREWLHIPQHFPTFPRTHTISSRARIL